MPLQDSDFVQARDGQWVALNPDYNKGCYTFQHRNDEGKPTGYTNLGFDVCIDRTVRYYNWLERSKSGATARQYSRDEIVAMAGRGTLAMYDLYTLSMTAMKVEAARRGIRCDADINPQLAPYVGKIVEVEDKYGETRRFKVGRSTGWLPVLLEIGKGASYGDPADNEYKSIRPVRGWKSKD